MTCQRLSSCVHSFILIGFRSSDLKPFISLVSTRMWRIIASCSFESETGLFAYNSIPNDGRGLQSKAEGKEENNKTISIRTCVAHRWGPSKIHVGPWDRPESKEYLADAAQERKVVASNLKKKTKFLARLEVTKALGDREELKKLMDEARAMDDSDNEQYDWDSNPRIVISWWLSRRPFVDPNHMQTSSIPFRFQKTRQQSKQQLHICRSEYYILL